MKGTSAKRVVVILVIGVALGAGIYFAPAFVGKTEPTNPVPATRLRTVGTSSAALMIENSWRTAYRMQKGIEVEYESTGSTKGIDQLIEGKYAIAFTHSPLSDEQRKKAKEKKGDLVQIPVVLCSVVPIYNLKELKDKPPLNFTGEVLAKIFLGTIDQWNHPELKKINAGVELPDTKIAVVHREDSSGTTFLFTDYLAGASPQWQEKVGKANSVITWPVGVGKSRSFDLLDHVRRTEGAIGYVDLVYPYFGALPYGAVENKDKTAFIHAEAKNMTAAAKQHLPSIRDDLGFALTNMPGSESYPICGAIWAVCYQNQPANLRDEVVNFLQWATHGAQQYTSTIWASLPEEVVVRIDEKINSIKVGS
jgi:phosphate ABC transporter phosphate-binding protein